MMVAQNNNVPANDLIFGNKTYNQVKWVAMVFIPALSTLYFTLGSVWDLPRITEVVGTLAALDTFLGLLLGLSTSAYNASNAKYDGDIEVNVSEVGNKMFSLNLNKDPEDLEKLSEVTFKVIPKE